VLVLEDHSEELNQELLGKSLNITELLFNIDLKGRVLVGMRGLMTELTDSGNIVDGGDGLSNAGVRMFQGVDVITDGGIGIPLVLEIIIVGDRLVDSGLVLAMIFEFLNLAMGNYGRKLAVRFVAEDTSDGASLTFPGEDRVDSSGDLVPWAVAGRSHDSWVIPLVLVGLDAEVRGFGSTTDTRSRSGRIPLGLRSAENAELSGFGLDVGDDIVNGLPGEKKDKLGIDRHGNTALSKLLDVVGVGTGAEILVLRDQSIGGHDKLRDGARSVLFKVGAVVDERRGGRSEGNIARTWATLGESAGPALGTLVLVRHIVEDAHRWKFANLILSLGLRGLLGLAGGGGS